MRADVQPRAVLIIGTPNDPHSGCIADKCREAGADCRILNEDHFLTLDFSHAGSAAAMPGSDGGGTGHDLAIWWRLKPGYFRNESDIRTNQFVKREWHHALESFEGLFPDAKWINPRPADRFIRHKPNQLHLARQIGFATPPTLITNDPARVLDFVSQQPGQQCIYKPLSYFFDAPNKLLFTNTIDRSFVNDNPSAIERAPGIYQTVIKKAYELRITVVEQAIFAARIDSQANEVTSLDWRRDLDGVGYAAEPELPAKFRERLLSFHAKSGLVYGAYDFIVTPDNEYVFLEVNPAGQWLWIEDATGMPVATAIASALMQDPQSYAPRQAARSFG